MGDFGNYEKINVPRTRGSDSNHANPQAASGSRLYIDVIPSPEIFNSLEDLQTTSLIGALTSTNHYSQPWPAAGGRLYPSPTPDKTAKKRESDRAYREKQKRGKEEINSKLVTMTEENSRLDAENRALKLQHKEMNEILQSQSEEILKLKSDNERLKSDYEKQHGLVQALSGLLANAPDLQLENKRLQIQNEFLKQLENVPDKMSHLMGQNGNLQLENRILRAQNNALCGRMISDQP